MSLEAEREISLEAEREMSLEAEHEMSLEAEREMSLEEECEMSLENERDIYKPPYGTLQNLCTGKKYPIIDKLSFGRSPKSTIVLEALANNQCIIRYTSATSFFISNYSDSSAYLNSNKMEKKKLMELHHSDYIRIGDDKDAKYLFRFIMHYPEKSPKFKKAQIDLKEIESYLPKMHKEIKDLKHIIVSQSQLVKSELQLKKRYFNAIKEKRNGDLNFSNFKSEVKSQCKSVLQCFLCKDLIIKSCITNCNHTFCMRCLIEWENQYGRRVCPICKTFITFTCNCSGLDNYIDNINHLLNVTLEE